MTSSAYRQVWRQHHPMPAPGSNRKQWGSPVKLSPRGLLDTNAIISDVQRENELEEYREQWRQQHGGQEPSPRGPINRGGGAAAPRDPRSGPGYLSPRSLKEREREEYKQLWRQQHQEGGPRKPAQYRMKGNSGTLDTDQIIREVEKEKREEEERMRNGVFGGVGGGGRPGKGAQQGGGLGGNTVDKDEYRRLWEQNKRNATSKPPAQRPVGRSNAPAASLDTDALIAEVTRDKMDEEYKKLWAERQALEASKKGAFNTPRNQDVSQFGDSQRNIESKIAEAKREADDYRKRWEAQHAKGKHSDPRFGGGSEELALPLGGGYEENKRKLKEERQRDYKEMLRQKNAENRKKWAEPVQEDPFPLGAYEENRRKLNEERQREYNEFQKQKRGYQGRPLREQTDEYKASSLGANESDAAKLQKIKERNDEYNQFLANKAEREQNRFGNRKPQESQGDGVYATIPGLRYSTSAQKRDQQEERNKEYNEMLRQKAQRGGRKGNEPPPNGPKQGWGTPTYEEMLDKKRALESNYRRANDIAYETDINVKETYQDANRMPGLDPKYAGKRDGNQQDGQYFATLPLGADPQTEAQRRKEEYKRDLQRQMAETAYARRTEKEQGLLINNNGIAANPETTRIAYEPRKKNPQVSAYHTKILEDLHKLDDISPRSNAILGRRQNTEDRPRVGGLNFSTGGGLPRASQNARPGGGGGILDLGFDTIVEPPRLTSLDPPAGLEYQPS